MIFYIDATQRLQCVSFGFDEYFQVKISIFFYKKNDFFYKKNDFFYKKQVAKITKTYLHSPPLAFT